MGGEVQCEAHRHSAEPHQGGQTPVDACPGRWPPSLAHQGEGVRKTRRNARRRPRQRYLPHGGNGALGAGLAAALTIKSITTARRKQSPRHVAINHHGTSQSITTARRNQSPRHVAITSEARGAKWLTTCTRACSLPRALAHGHGAESKREPARSPHPHSPPPPVEAETSILARVDKHPGGCARPGDRRKRQPQLRHVFVSVRARVRARACACGCARIIRSLVGSRCVFA